MDSRDRQCPGYKYSCKQSVHLKFSLSVMMSYGKVLNSEVGGNRIRYKFFK